MRSHGESENAREDVERAAGSAAPGSGRWLRVKAIFLEIVERPRSERGGALDELCAGDQDVRREVESLFASEAEASGLLELPAHTLFSDDDTDAWRPRLEPGARLGQYEISNFIAAGGMGEVYRARHTVLDRAVAIKTVGGDPSDSTGRRRLIREAQHAATLTHRNICTIYEVGETADQPFIVMEYLDGRSLREVLHQGPCELRRALRIGVQVADALSHAHEHGIIHRDLKSSNIVVDSTGRAIVLDFGLAKRVPSSNDGAQRDSTLTTQGAVAGTLSHMAPELLLGSQADARSDVWALGVLLYELVTGQLPFTGRTSYETSAAILADPPRPMGTHVPLALRLVIEQCLAKKPDARYQQASDVRGALDAIERRRSWPLVGRLLISTRRRTLQALAAAVVLIPALVWTGARLRTQFARLVVAANPTLAILPLANASGDSTTSYFADGMTDALIAQLGATANVRVISRASASRVAKGGATTADVAKRLGANMLVEGTLRRSSGRVAVDMRLMEPSRGRVLWSDTYDRDAADVLVLQADVVRAIAQAIRLTIRPDAETRLTMVRAVRPDVYEEFLKGRFAWNQRTPESLRQAVAHFTRAVELDPTYAPAHAALADCYNQLGTVMVGTGSPQQFRPRAEAEAIKALQIDPYSAEAHAALGYAKHYGLQWTDADHEFRRAIELNPSYSLVHVWYANLLMSRRRFDEALREVGSARELDPFSLIVNTNVAWILDFSGRHQAAIDQLRATLALDSGYVQAHMRLAGALVSAGRFDEALVEARRVLALTGRTPSGLSGLAVTLARAGHREEAEQTLAELVELSHAHYVPAWSIGSVYAALGIADSAEVWMERAFEEKSNVIAYLGVDPEARTLRGNPRFQRVLAQAGYQ
jgi:TolB-like protein/tetratricopeptide (TPR) repeat protein/predicted Ser/Thr protein kinase